MTAPAADLPTVADFLDDATARLDRLTPRLALCRHEDVDTVAAVRELHRIAAQLAAALRMALTGQPTSPAFDLNTTPRQETDMHVPDSAEGRLIDLIDRWKIDHHPADGLMPAVEEMPAFLGDLDTVLRDLRRERSGHLGTIDERDQAQDAADRLAYAIAPVEVIGEHSSGNDPWAEALEVLAQRRTEHDRLSTENAALRHALFVAPAAAAPARVFTGHDDDWGLPLFLNMADAKTYAEMEFEARFPGWAAEYGDGAPIGWKERDSRTERGGHPDMWDMVGGGADYVLYGVVVHPSLASALAERPIEKNEPEPEPQIPGQGALPVEAPRGFRIGDMVQITGRHDDEGAPDALRLLGATGYVTELDPGAEYSIGLTVEGWLGPVWCDSGEIRHRDGAQSGAER